MKRLLITEIEKQYILNLYEQDSGFTRYLDKQYSTERGTQEVKKMYNDVGNFVDQLRKRNPALFDTLTGLGLFVIPLIGPYLSAGYSATAAMVDLKNKKYVDGVIGLITSPLGLMKSIRLLKLMGGVDGQLVKMLETINKTGLPVLTSKGREEFLKWGYKTFNREFDRFMNLVGDKQKMEGLLKDIVNELKSKIK
jgi:hypothetical protein